MNIYSQKIYLPRFQIIQIMQNTADYLWGGGYPSENIYKQCCGSGSASKDELDPDPHQSGKLDPDPHQLAYGKPKSMKFEPN
jgi:hypothetical protein